MRPHCSSQKIAVRENRSAAYALVVAEVQAGVHFTEAMASEWMKWEGAVGAKYRRVFELDWSDASCVAKNLEHELQYIFRRNQAWSEKIFVSQQVDGLGAVKDHNQSALQRPFKQHSEHGCPGNRERSTPSTCNAQPCTSAPQLVGRGWEWATGGFSPLNVCTHRGRRQHPPRGTHGSA